MLSRLMRSNARNIQGFFPESGMLSLRLALMVFIIFSQEPGRKDRGQNITRCHFHVLNDHTSNDNDYGLAADPQADHRVSGVPYQASMEVRAPEEYIALVPTDLKPFTQSNTFGDPSAVVQLPAVVPGKLGVHELLSFYLLDEHGNYHLHCGCLLEEVLLDFYVWKATPNLRSVSLNVEEPLGHPIDPRIRAYYHMAFTTLGIHVEDLYRFDVHEQLRPPVHGSAKSFKRFLRQAVSAEKKRAERRLAKGKDKATDFEEDEDENVDEEEGGARRQSSKGKEKAADLDNAEELEEEGAWEDQSIDDGVCNVDMDHEWYVNPDFTYEDDNAHMAHDNEPESVDERATAGVKGHHNARVISVAADVGENGHDDDGYEEEGYGDDGYQDDPEYDDNGYGSNDYQHTPGYDNDMYGNNGYQDVVPEYEEEGSDDEEEEEEDEEEESPRWGSHRGDGGSSPYPSSIAAGSDGQDAWEPEEGVSAVPPSYPSSVAEGSDGGQAFSSPNRSEYPNYKQKMERKDPPADHRHEERKCYVPQRDNNGYQHNAPRITKHSSGRAAPSPSPKKVSIASHERDHRRGAGIGTLMSAVPHQSRHADGTRAPSTREIPPPLPEQISSEKRRPPPERFHSENDTFSRQRGPHRRDDAEGVVPHRPASQARAVLPSNNQEDDAKPSKHRPPAKRDSARAHSASSCRDEVGLTPVQPQPSGRPLSPAESRQSAPTRPHTRKEDIARIPNQNRPSNAPPPMPAMQQPPAAKRFSNVDRLEQRVKPKQPPQPIPPSPSQTAQVFVDRRLPEAGRNAHNMQPYPQHQGVGGQRDATKRGHSTKAPPSLEKKGEGGASQKPPPRLQDVSQDEATRQPPRQRELAYHIPKGQLPARPSVARDSHPSLAAPSKEGRHPAQPPHSSLARPPSGDGRHSMQPPRIHLPPSDRNAGSSKQGGPSRQLPPARPTGGRSGSEHAVVNSRQPPPPKRPLLSSDQPPHHGMHPSSSHQAVVKSRQPPPPKRPLPSSNQPPHHGMHPLSSHQAVVNPRQPPPPKRPLPSSRQHPHHGMHPSSSHQAVVDSRRPPPPKRPLPIQGMHASSGQREKFGAVRRPESSGMVSGSSGGAQESDNAPRKRRKLGRE